MKKTFLFDGVAESLAGLVLLVALSAFPEIPASAESPPKSPKEYAVVATVNGDPITSLDVFLDTIPERERLVATCSGDKLGEKMREIEMESINRLIDSKLVFERFKKRGYKIPREIVERFVDKIAANVAGGDRKMLAEKARKAGMTMDDIRMKALERAAVMILLDARCEKAVNITPKQVWDYYQDHKDEFAKPPRVSLQILFLKPYHEKAAVELAPLLVTADEFAFSKFVLSRSDSPNVTNGGKIGWINEEDLRPEFAELKGKPKGIVAGPIKTREGFYFVRICDKKAPEAPSFESLQKDIRNTLKKAEVKEKYDEYVGNLRKNAVIRIFLDQK